MLPLWNVNNSLTSAEICAANWLMNHRVSHKKKKEVSMWQKKKKQINFRISAICQSLSEMRVLHFTFLVRKSDWPRERSWSHSNHRFHAYLGLSLSIKMLGSEKLYQLASISGPQLMWSSSPCSYQWDFSGDLTILWASFQLPHSSLKFLFWGGI